MQHHPLARSATSFYSQHNNTRSARQLRADSGRCESRRTAFAHTQRRPARDRDLALSMDGRLDPIANAASPRQQPGVQPESRGYVMPPENSLVGAMPPEASLEMPVQNPRSAPQREPHPRQSAVTWLARLIATATTLGIAVYGVSEMIAIVGFSNMTILQGVMIFFFAVTLSWIAFAAGSTVAGLLTPAIRSRAATPADSVTALLVPVCNEDPLRTTAALQAMAEALAAMQAAQHFEIVIISESTNADAWIAESIAVDRLRRALAETMPVRYRRR